MHGRTVWQGEKNKTVVWGMATLVKSLGNKNEEEIDTYYLTERKLAEAVEAGDFGTVFDGLISDDEKEIKMPPGEKNIPHLYIDVKNVPTRISKSRNVACCAYSATSEFCKHFLGFGLDNHDRSWYSRHALVTTDGLPQKNSFTVIQQLVEPYGAGISRITVPRNSRRFDEFRPFMVALGCNPYFAIDGHTTNEEALEKLNVPEEHREKFLSQWRFECSDKPFAGAIIMNQFQHTSVGHNGGSNYYGPRAPVTTGNNFQEWKMAIKIDRLENISYLRPMDIPEYEEFGGSITLDWWSIKDKSGKTLRQISDSQRKLPVKYSGKGGEGSFSSQNGWKGSTSGRPDPTTSSRMEEDDEKMWAYPPLCEICQKDPGEDCYTDGRRVCQFCGGKQEMSRVSVYELVDGWLPASEDSPFDVRDWRSDNDEVDFNPFSWDMHWD
jgi:hypothetical protein